MFLQKLGDPDIYRWDLIKFKSIFGSVNQKPQNCDDISDWTSVEWLDNDGNRQFKPTFS